MIKLASKPELAYVDSIDWLGRKSLAKASLILFLILLKQNLI